MKEAQVYNQDGQATSKVSLPEGFFALPWNADLVHQVVTAVSANNRQNSAYAKDRSAVSGGGKKPWRQKGTGRARHGSSRSPIWIGGGVTHGPTLLRNYTQKINKKIKSKAFFTLLSKKFSMGKVFFTEEMFLSNPQTKLAEKFVDSLAGAVESPKMKYKTGNRVLVIVPEKNDTVLKSFRNLPQVAVFEARDVGILDLAGYEYVVISDPKASFAVFETRLKFAPSKDQSTKEKEKVTKKSSELAKTV